MDKITSVGKEKGFTVENLGDLGLSLRTNELSVSFMKRGSGVIVGTKTEEEAIQIANDNDYGLSSGVFSEDAERCDRVSRSLEAGICFKNCECSICSRDFYYLDFFCLRFSTLQCTTIISNVQHVRTNDLIQAKSTVLCLSLNNMQG